MVKRTIKGVDYEMRNLQSEITLLETSQIAEIMASDKGDFADKWLKVIEMLGSKELVKVASSKDFVYLVGQIEMNDVKFELKETIEVNGRVYKCAIENNEIDLSALDLAKLENIARKGGAWLHKAFAVVYKDEALTNNEHYDDAHLKHKAEVFGKYVTAQDASSIIFQINQQVVENVQQLINAQGQAIS